MEWRRLLHPRGGAWTARIAPVAAAPALAALALAAAAMLVAAAFAGAAPGRAQARITVLAASSLADVLRQVDPAPRYAFGGSDTLASQIELGAPADVFAAASTKLPERLHAAGLVDTPVVFTANRLVLVVPKANPAGLRSVYGLRRAGVKLLVGAATVPVGAYTRTALARIGLSRVLAAVVSEESDVRSILGKVGLGEADAGFVYATDARALAGKVTVIALPAKAQPEVRYAVAIVTSSRNRAAAAAFVRRLLSTAGQAKLAAAGFFAP